MPRGPRPMGFVIQAVAGKAEACSRTGVLEQADNAASGRLGAKSAAGGGRGMA
jgi:hypothetical protein